MDQKTARFVMVLFIFGMGVALGMMIQKQMDAREVHEASSAIRTVSHDLQQTVCIQHLREIEAAKTQWLLDHPKRDPLTQLTPKDLVGSTSYIKELPECPSGGAYDYGDSITPATCSIPEHQIPDGPIFRPR
jgi:hypothetical protein